MEAFIFYTLYLAVAVVMPFWAWRTKRKTLAFVLALLNIYWLWGIYDYFNSGLENEAGVVIVGMLFLTPFIMLFSNLIAVGIAALFRKGHVEAPNK